MLRKYGDWRILPSQSVIQLSNIRKQYGRQILLMEASASINRGEKVGLVGPNGAGKTTIFRLITGEEEPDEGHVSMERGNQVGYFSQDVGELEGMPVLAAALDGAGQVSALASELKVLEFGLGDPEQADQLDALIERFGEVQSQYDALGGYALEGRAKEILGGLGFTDAMIDDDVGKLSGGWKMRVALARILVMAPDALLLDEPSNYLDIESIIWLEQFIRRYEGAVLMTSHDRALMNRVVGKIIALDGGELTSYSGDYDFYDTQRQMRERQVEAQYDRQQSMLAKEQAFIDRFKARASHAAQVQSRVKKLDKIDKVEPPKRIKTLRFDFRPAPRSGEDVLSIKGVTKTFADRAIYKDFDFLVRRKERWCVMGENGAGKSTLLKMVAHAIEPDIGTVTVGASVKMGYFAQHTMDLLDPQRTVWEVLQDKFPLAGIGSLRTLAGVFGFPGDDIEKKCKFLSGGEKARLVMATLLYDSPNFLVLDEPTNHLDIATKEMLVAALATYEGAMLFVSHDRNFLGAVSNRVLELTAKGPLTYLGGYSEYVESSGHEAPGLRA